MTSSEWTKVANRWAGSGGRLVEAQGQRSFASAGTVKQFGALRPNGAARMDFNWVTGRIGVGGGIWNAENMAAVARAGVTHIIDMQREFDDTPLARPLGIEVLWNPVEDDFQPKPAEVFQVGVDFARKTLDQSDTKLLIHCAAGIHRAPMMALAVLCSLSWKLPAAMELIAARRPTVEFADVYVRSVENFLERRVSSERAVSR